MSTSKHPRTDIFGAQEITNTQDGMTLALQGWHKLCGQIESELTEERASTAKANEIITQCREELAPIQAHIEKLVNVPINFGLGIDYLFLTDLGGKAVLENILKAHADLKERTAAHVTALQRLGTHLKLPAGADLHTEIAPSIVAMQERLTKLEAFVDRANTASRRLDWQWFENCAEKSAELIAERKK